MTTLHLTKHHGAGNDFLVLLDPARQVIVIDELARALCDRRTGVGADGLLHLERPSAGDADFDLTVWNADGSIAETSGNGLRCAAQAIVDAGLAPPELSIRTGNAARRVRAEPETAPGHRQVTVGMGPARLVEEGESVVSRIPSASLPASHAAVVDVSNPHLVAAVNDLTALDDRFMVMVSEEALGYPVNLEVIAIGGGDIRMRVWERGVGETFACGSGSVAAATAAHRWGLVGTAVAVHTTGGTVNVDIADEFDVLLTGPAKFVARVEVDSTRILP